MLFDHPCLNSVSSLISNEISASLAENTNPISIYSLISNKVSSSLIDDPTEHPKCVSIPRGTTKPIIPITFDRDGVAIVTYENNAPLLNFMS